MPNILGECPAHADQQDEGCGCPNPGGYPYIYRMGPNYPFGIVEEYSTVDISSCENE